MENIPTKSDGDSYTSSEYNNVESQEPQNVVSTAGLTFDSGNLTQLKEAQHIISSFSSSYNESGVVNAYVLTQGSGFNITAYFEGMGCSFVTPNANSGAATVDVNGLGVVPILNPDLTPLTGGEISNTVVNRIVYNGGNFIVATIDGLDVQLRNELASIVNPFGTTLIGTTNVNVESIIRRAYGRISSVQNPSTLTIVNSNNVATISYNTEVFGINVFFQTPMDTENYIVTGSASYPLLVNSTDLFGGVLNTTFRTRNSFTANCFVGSQEVVPNSFTFSVYEYRP